MTYLKHSHGKHYTEYEGPGWSICFFVLTGQALTKIKTKTVYRGAKGENKRKKPIWRLFI